MNTVTIMFSKQIMVTKEPCEKDYQFIGITQHLHNQWIKDGKPLSNQGF